ncbi:cache domain-containing protein [Desulfosarcina ovata]|uniref:histidine kinase n=1 Tax=Desulfosarcina ovata subsp. ovata TaxID=2752305 RepID=A0A5K8A5X7_9BACT|nr:cache domain-containing protein [Desulfosarcina ovata]BBO87861.1 hypothetical protein DSCOOX_10410 [Desulfosarcina ovata subsp. ovata]
MRFRKARVKKEASLRAKMIFGGILILFVPVFFIGSVTFINSSRTSEDIAKLQFVQIAQSLSGMLELALNKDLKVLEKIAKDPKIIAAMIAQNKTVIRSDLSVVHQMFSPNYEGVGVFNADGIVYCDGIDIAREGIYIGDRQYFKEAKKGRPGVLPVVRSRATGASVFGVSAPMFSPEGDFLGGVVGVLKVDHLIDYISTIQIGRTGYAFMLDPEGLVIAHPDKNIVLKVHIRDMTGLDALISKVESRQAGTVSYTYAGKKKIAGLAPVELTGWTIGVCQNREEILSLAHDNITFTLMISALFALLTILAVLVLSGKISVPVEQKLSYLSHAPEQAMEATQAGAWEADPVTQTVTFSDQWFTMLGRKPQRARVSLKKTADFIHPEDYPAMIRTIEEFLAGGGKGQSEIEFRLRRADGSWCWVLSKSRAIERNEKGEPARIIGLDINIEKIKAAQIELAQSESRFRALFRLAPLPLAEVAGDRIVGINERFHMTLGYTIGNLPTQDVWWEKAFPDLKYRSRVKSGWQAEVDRARKEKTDAYGGEWQVTAKDGTVHTMVISAGAIGNSMLISFFDITERKQIENIQQESLELLRATFDATPDGIMVVDQNLNVTQANRQLYRMWRIPRELQGNVDEQALREFVSDQLVDPAGFQNLDERLYQSRTQDEYEFLFKDGRVFTCYSAPMILNENEIGRVWDFRDISKQKRAEAEREKLQGQLLQAQKLEAIGNLAGGLAHDFNNMLGIITGYAELTLKELADNNPFRGNIEQIIDAAQRSAALTRQLLIFSRKQRVKPVLIDLNVAINAMLNMLRRLIGENIELNWLPPDEPCPVKIDPSQLDQILFNLCINARDAISDIGRITIKADRIFFDETAIKAYVDCTPGDYVHLSIEDNGSGIDKETAKHVFEPFFTTKEVGRGTGLGLATIYGIVKQNGGGIKFYSEPGSGTVFNIYLPKAADEIVPEQAQHYENIPLGRGETILIVEDEPSLMEMGQIMLARLGYEVLPATTPGEAIQMVKECSGDIHLFLTDVIMPEMNGRELIDRLLDIRPGTKYMFMSGYAADVITGKGAIDQASNFIQKPFNLKDFAGKLREILNGSDRETPDDVKKTD